jgi:hypothetical protein
MDPFLSKTVLCRNFIGVFECAEIDRYEKVRYLIEEDECNNLVCR